MKNKIKYQQLISILFFLVGIVLITIVYFTPDIFVLDFTLYVMGAIVTFIGGIKMGAILEKKYINGPFRIKAVQVLTWEKTLFKSVQKSVHVLFWVSGFCSF